MVVPPLPVRNGVRGTMPLSGVLSMSVATSAVYADVRTPI